MPKINYRINPYIAFRIKKDIENSFVVKNSKIAPGYLKFTILLDSYNGFLVDCLRVKYKGHLIISTRDSIFKNPTVKFITVFNDG